MQDFDQNDPLWNLLGRTKPTQASPYFARKVLRAVREGASRPASFSLSGLLRWLVPVSACAAITLAWVSFHATQQREIAKFNEQFDVLADLPALVVHEDTSLWIDG